ncbi:MAG: PAS domain S-box protein [Chlamydiota bacterium]|nr:PAS domain S-box protein [Chlamydiota bacterium]
MSKINIENDHESETNQKLYKKTFAASVDPIFVINADGSVRSFNPAAENLTEYSSVEAIGKKIHELLFDAYGENYDKFLEDFLEKEQKSSASVSQEIALKTKSGKEIFIYLSLSDAHINGIQYYIGVLRDISNVKTVQDELRKSEKISQAVLNTAIDGIITISSKGIIQSINPAALRLFGYSLEDLLGQNVSKLMPNPHSSQHDGYLANYAKTGVKKIIGIGREVTCLRKDGSTFPGHLSISEFQIDGNTNFTGIIRDITQVKDAEEQIKKTNLELSKETWIRQGQVNLLEALRGNLNLKKLSSLAVKELAFYTDGISGVMYIMDQGTLRLQSSVNDSNHNKDSIELNEGIIGRAASLKKMIKISGEAAEKKVLSIRNECITPKEIIAFPLLHDSKTMGVIELVYQRTIESKVEALLSFVMESLGLLLNSAINREKVNFLLTEAQLQEEKLIKSNKALEQKSVELLSQQKELEEANSELTKQGIALEKQKEDLEVANRNLIGLKNELEKKARDLQVADKYKSDFLANMSHELRTPLNCIMILSKLLGENLEKNMTEDQKENAQIIFSSAEDLNKLIDDILDLSKIEAGKLDIISEEIFTEDLVKNLQRGFIAQATNKGLNYRVIISEDAPRKFFSDFFRVEQVIKNFISNAIKFTAKGFVEVLIDKVGERTQHLKGHYDPINDLAIVVTDSGIGIPNDKLELIFQAFQQVDGTITRKFGGTGLGLSITKKLSEMLGGEIIVETETEKGSAFTFCIPAKLTMHSEKSPLSVRKESEGDGEHKKIQPCCLPGTTSCLSDLEGVVSRLSKAKVEKRKTVLVVDDQEAQKQAIANLMTTSSAKVVYASTAVDAIDLLKKHKIDCMLLNLELSEMGAIHMFKELNVVNDEIALPSTIVYPGEELSDAEANLLNAYPKLVINTGSRLLGQLLEKIEQVLNKEIKETDKRSFLNDDIFRGKKVLIVDDDHRNSYSMKQILQGKGFEIYLASNGLEALDLIKNNSDIDLVLMDIMMPEMDGYEAMAEIRKMHGKDQLCIIAVTAKAMKGDREKCIQAGASDYVVKPINPEKLLLVMRDWLSSGTCSYL